MTHQMGESEWAGRWRAGWGWTETFAAPVSELRDDKDARVKVMHRDFPGWDFFVTFSPAGVPVGFAVQATVPVSPNLGKWTREGTPPREPFAPPVTARFLRRIPVGEIQDLARRAILDLGGRMSSPGTVERWGHAFQEVKRPGRSGRDDRAYAEVAALYVEKLRTNPKTALKDLADDLGYSRSQVRNVLYTARRRRLLTAAQPGKAGGELTEKALALLRHDEGSK